MLPAAPVGVPPEQNKGTHSFCCAKREAGWEPAVPALLRQHPAGQSAVSLGIVLPPRPGQIHSPHRCPSNAISTGKLSLCCGATGKAERQVSMAAIEEHGFSLPAAARHCSHQQNSPTLLPARQPRAPGGLKQNKLLQWDYPSVPRQAEQASVSVLGSGLLSNHKQSWLIFSCFVQSSTKNSPKRMGLISL